MSEVVELLDAMRRFESAASPDVCVVRIAWPAFAAFNDAYRALEKARDHFPTAQSVEADVTRYRRARSILRSSLATPSDPDVGLVPGPTEPAVGGELGALQTALRELASQLAAEDHPAVARVTAMIDGSDRRAWPRAGTTRLIVSGIARDATGRALAGIGAEQGVSWDVRTLTEAKQAGPCDVTLLAGSPELLLSFRTEPEMRSALVGWLFNAPMSPHVVALVWPGSQDFDSARYEPFPGSSLLDPRFSGDQSALVKTLEYDDILVPSNAPPPRASAPGAIDAVPAIDLQLPDGYWISFGVEFGPRPMRVDEDEEFVVEVEMGVSPHSIRAGNVLVIREASADRTFRRALCAQWIAQHEKKFDIDGAMSTVNAYKESVRRVHFRPELFREIRQRGIEETYLRQQIARAFDPNTIAPRDYSTFETIASVTGIKVSQADWLLVKALRNGYKHAGRQIGRMLREAVRNDRSWVDVVAQQQIAQITVADIGTVTLAPVLRVLPDSSLRPLSELGDLIRP